MVLRDIFCYQTSMKKLLNKIKSLFTGWQEVVEEEEKELTFQTHRLRHEKLHNHLDELLADWITHTGKRPSESTVRELLEWSFQQTIQPTEREQ